MAFLDSRDATVLKLWKETASEVVSKTEAVEEAASRDKNKDDWPEGNGMKRSVTDYSIQESQERCQIMHSNNTDNSCTHIIHSQIVQINHALISFTLIIQTNRTLI